MSQTSTLVISTFWLFLVSALLFVCSIALFVDAWWLKKHTKRWENIYTSNSDLSQEETQRMKTVRKIS